MISKPIKPIVLLGYSILIALILGEIAVRLCGQIDRDGNFYVNKLRCYPYHMPVKTMQVLINEYLASTRTPEIYDRNLGWAPRPKSQSRNGLYIYNEEAIRTPSENTVISRSPSTGVTRISIFGDSFTHGDDVLFQETWGNYLEEDLKNHHMNAEVLNFGVGGYGMDQAYLRWKEQGHLYKPSIVIFGLQLENMNRNVNLIRPVYIATTSLPFAKPRFILEHGNLSLINVPVPDPQRMLGIMNDFSSWGLSKYEHWYEPQEYQDNILFNSKLAAFIYSWSKNYSREHKPYYGEDLEDLSLKIITSFKEDVESQGGKFYVVYLPLRRDVKLLQDTGIFPNTYFLRKLETVVTVIHPEARLSQKEEDLETLIPAHYGPEANKTVADVVADFILRSDH